MYLSTIDRRTRRARGRPAAGDRPPGADGPNADGPGGHTPGPGTTSSPGTTRGSTSTGGRVARRALVSGNVLALGTVSLLTDVSAEMVTAVLPLYLVLGLHLTPAAYGVLDGLYTGATALLRLAGGYLADRLRRRKAVAGVGYAISAVAKLALLAARASGPGIAAAIVADRAGKGLRTAPRDALITLSTPTDRLGGAFGVHRAMDSAGAFAGPLVALAVLTASGQAFDAVFVTSFCIAVLGVLVLVLFVRDRRGGVPASGPVSLRAAVALAQLPRLRPVLLASVLMGLVTIGDGFVYLLLQRRYDLAVGWFPLLAVGTNLAYLLLAAPLGTLADRVGRHRVCAAGIGALAGVYLLLALPGGGPSGVVPAADPGSSGGLFPSGAGWFLIAVTLLLHGAFYAATDGVLVALAGPVLPERLRTTGIALVQTGQALAYLASSVLFGIAWQSLGERTAVLAAAGFAAAVLVAVVAAGHRVAARAPAGAGPERPEPLPQGEATTTGGEKVP